MRKTDFVTDYSLVESAKHSAEAPRQRTSLSGTFRLQNVLCGIALVGVGFVLGATVSGDGVALTQRISASHAAILASEPGPAHGKEPEEPEGKGEGEKEEEEEEEGPPAAIQLLVTCAIMVFTLLLLRLFEYFVEWFDEHIHPALKPVINSMLAELAGVGTIGLLLKLFLNNFSGPVEELSIICFGEGDTLVEAFEFIHTRIFEVAALFFAFNGRILGRFIQNENKLTEAVLSADKDGDGKVTPAEFIAAFGSDADADGDGEVTPEEFMAYVNKPQSAWAQLTGGFNPVVDAYLFRRRFKLTQKLPKEWGWAATGEYNVVYAGHVIDELVELNPFTWAPLVPLVGLIELIKISKGVVGEDAEGKAVGAYLAYGNGVLLVMALLLSLVACSWSWYNFKVLASVKEMVKPKMRKTANGFIEVSAPAMVTDVETYLDDHSLLMKITEGVSAVTRLFTPRHEHPHHKLFGAVGHHADHLFLRSIKYHTWLLVLCLTFGMQIILRDAASLLSEGVSGAPPGALSELLVYMPLNVLFLGMLLVLTPLTASMYGSVMTVEGFMQRWAVERVCAKHGWKMPK